MFVFGVCVGLYYVIGVRHDAAAFPNLMHRPQGETFECQNQKKKQKFGMVLQNLIFRKIGDVHLIHGI